MKKIALCVMLNFSLFLTVAQADISQADLLRKQHSARNQGKTPDEKRSVLGVREHRSPSLTTSSGERHPLAEGLVNEEIRPDTSSPTIKFDHRWTRFLGVGTPKDYLRLKPVLHKDQLFAADPSGQVEAVDANTGKRLWKMRLSHAITSGPVLHNKTLLLTTEQPQLIALHIKTGKIAWVSPLPNLVLAPPTALDSQVLIKTISGEVLALNPHNGEIFWRYHHSNPLLALRGASSRPHLINQEIWVGFPDGKLLTLEATHGTLLKEHRLAQPKGLSEAEPLIDIAADLLFVNETLYISTYQGTLTALEASTGAIKWQHPLSNYTDLAIGSYLYASDEEGVLWAFHPDTGEVIWKQTELQGRKITAPVLSQIGQCLIAADHQGVLYSFSQATGKLLARLPTSKQHAAILIPPLVEGHHVYTLNSQGRLAGWILNDELNR